MKEQPLMKTNSKVLKSQQSENPQNLPNSYLILGGESQGDFRNMMEYIKCFFLGNLSRTSKPSDSMKRRSKT